VGVEHLFEAPVTAEEIIALCGDSAAGDWIYWTYAPWALAEGGSLPAAEAQAIACAYYARAAYRCDLAVNLAWGTTARPGQQRRDWSPEAELLAQGRHWVDLLHDNRLVGRFLAVLVEGGCASLPAPREERCAGRATLWVSRLEFEVVRLANRIEPRCRDFERHFERARISVR
jgi:hypothetical protein